MDVVTQAADGQTSERAQLLAFVADPETRQALDQVVADLMIPGASIRNGDVRDAVTALGESRSPRLLIVDIAGRDLPISDINELAEVCEPGVAVIAIGDRNDVGLFRDLIQHGLADYLVKPVTPQLLQRSLLSAVEGYGAPRQTTRLGRLVVTVGVRGGVGATTLATGLAWEIANRRKRRVALLDMDVQFGSVALALDLDPCHGLREALENTGRIDSLYIDRTMIKCSDTLHVLSAEEDIEEPVEIDRGALELLVNELRSKFHFVLVDVPKSGSAATQQLMAAATDLVIVTDGSLAGMRDTLRLTQHLARSNAACQSLIVMNKAGEYKHGELSRSDVEKGVGRAVDFVVPFDVRTVAQAVNGGRAVTSTNGAASQAMARIADKIMGGSKKSRIGLLDRLKFVRAGK